MGGGCKWGSKGEVNGQVNWEGGKLLQLLYSTGRGKTGKTDAPIENELDIVRN